MTTGQQPQNSLDGTTGDRSAEIVAMIARLEKAMGPDRDIDALIDCLIEGRTFQGFSRSFGGDAYKHGQSAEHYSCWPLVNVPKFTTSIDAALTLMPEGWKWLKFNQRPGDYGCFLDAIDTAGATPAIALCIAALKARATTSVDRSPDVSSRK